MFTATCQRVLMLEYKPSFPGTDLHTVNGNIAFSLAGALTSTDGDYCSCYTVNLDKLAKHCSLLGEMLLKSF